MHDLRIQRVLGKLIVYVLLIIICFLAFLPFLWMLRAHGVDPRAVHAGEL